MLEKSLRRLREQHQLRDVSGTGAPLQLLDYEAADAVTAPAGGDGHRAQQCDRLKTLQGAGAYELGVLVSDDELRSRGGEVARRQASALEQDADALRVLRGRSP